MIERVFKTLVRFVERFPALYKEIYDVHYSCRLFERLVSHFQITFEREGKYIRPFFESQRYTEYSREFTELSRDPLNIEKKKNLNVNISVSRWKLGNARWLIRIRIYKYLR